jgi:hypothetical protein
MLKGWLMKRPEADIFYVLVFVAFCVAYQIRIAAGIMFLIGLRVIDSVASWFDSNLYVWIENAFEFGVIFICCMPVSFLMAFVLRVSAWASAILAGLGAVIARHYLYDNFDMQGLIAYKLISDLVIVISAVAGVEGAVRLRRFLTRRGNADSVSFPKR